MKANNSTNEPEITLPVPAKFHVVVVLPVLVFITVTNSIIFRAFIKQPTLRTVKNAPLLSLAIADILVGLTWIPVYLISRFHPGHKGICRAGLTIGVFTLSGSLLNLVTVSIERWIAIFLPLRYDMIMHRCKVSLMISTAWSLAIVVSFMFRFADNGKVSALCRLSEVVYPWFPIFAFTFFYIFCCLMGYMQIKVFRTVRYQQGQIQNVTVVTFNNSNDILTINADARRPNMTSRQRELTRAMVISSLYLAFVLMLTPQMLLILLTTLGYCPNCNFAVVGSGILAWINSGVNPMIFALRMPEFRRTVKCRNLLCCRCIPAGVAPTS